MPFGCDGIGVAVLDADFCAGLQHDAHALQHDAHDAPQPESQHVTPAAQQAAGLDALRSVVCAAARAGRNVATAITTWIKVVFMADLSDERARSGARRRLGRFERKHGGTKRRFERSGSAGVQRGRASRDGRRKLQTRRLRQLVIDRPQRFAQ